MQQTKASPDNAKKDDIGKPTEVTPGYVYCVTTGGLVLHAVEGYPYDPEEPLSAALLTDDLTSANLEAAKIQDLKETFFQTIYER